MRIKLVVSLSHRVNVVNVEVNVIGKGTNQGKRHSIKLMITFLPRFHLLDFWSFVLRICYHVYLAIKTAIFYIIMLKISCCCF